MRSVSALAALVLLLSACGSGGDDDGAVIDTSDTPACSDVWAEGGSVPTGYEGCAEGGSLEAAISYACADGRVLYVSDRGYGFAGEPLVLMDEDEMASDPGYSAALYDECKPD